MSKKNQSKRDAYAKKQEEKGKKVMVWTFGVLLALALIYLIWSFSLLS